MIISNLNHLEVVSEKIEGGNALALAASAALGIGADNAFSFGATNTTAIDGPVFDLAASAATSTSAAS